MARNIIVGTAGHIDHGKTALIKALTGIDADRLKEEKQRGITIDIGFADLKIGEFNIGFVDVPGHERFIKNMLAGAHGLDLVMLVVAADESVMPQTREHFDICRLLQIKSGLIALTKVDLVDEELLELAQTEVEEFTKGSFLEGAPIVPVSSRTGAGIGELKDALCQLASTIQPRHSDSLPRLPVDRSFSIKGFGTVVTGTLIAGEIAIGDELEVLPSSVRSRVRNLQVHGSDTDRALAGQRTAVNLQGISVEQAPRGSVLVPAGRLQTHSMIDARLELLPNAPRRLQQRARVRLHHGTAEVMARVVILSDAEDRAGVEDRTAEPKSPALRSIEPGQNALVQLRLEEPIAVLPRDRFIMRSYSPQLTIGGGVVIDSSPEKHRIKDLRAVERLRQLEEAGPKDFAAGMIELAGANGISLPELAARTGATDKQLSDLRAMLMADGQAIEVPGAPFRLLSVASLNSLSSGVLAALKEHHEREPLSLGMAREEIRERVFGRAVPEVFKAVVNHLSGMGKITADKDTLKLATHKPELSQAETEARNRLEEAVRSAGLQAESLEELASRAGIKIELARRLYTLLNAEGRFVRIGDMIFHREVLSELARRVGEQKAISPRMDVAAFKQITGGISRKHAIPLLEYLDRERITRRIGNEREIL